MMPLAWCNCCISCPKISVGDRMSQTTVRHVIGIDGTTLIVFVAEASCWQLGLISAGRAVFGERKIYYTAEAALKAGLEWIAWGIYSINFSQIELALSVVKNLANHESKL